MGPIKIPVMQASAQATQVKIRLIRFSIDHIPTGEEFRLKVNYTLEADHMLKYSAYYYSMPIEMNHMDSMTWPAGKYGILLFETALRLLPKLSELKDGEVEPPIETFIVGISEDEKDSTFFVRANESKEWQEINNLFQKMIAEFEVATGRPLSPGELPR